MESEQKPINVSDLEEKSTIESMVESSEEIAQYTFTDLQKAFWTIDDAPLYSDVEGQNEVDQMPYLAQIIVYRQCNETGYYELWCDGIGYCYISPDYLAEEVDKELHDKIMAEKNPDGIDPEKIEATREFPGEDAESSTEEPSTAPSDTNDKNILDAQPEGDYVPSTYEENGYTFLDLGYMTISYDSEKTIYSDVEMTNAVGTWRSGSTIGMRQCLETGAIEVWMGNERGSAWISSEGVRMGI